MIKANARIFYSVMATCPYCRYEWDLSEWEGDTGEEMQELFEAVFVGSWSGLKLKYHCPECGEPFQLSSIGG